MAGHNFEGYPNLNPKIHILIFICAWQWITVTQELAYSFLHQRGPQGLALPSS